MGKGKGQSGSFKGLFCAPGPHILYLFYSESANRGPIDLQDAVPGVDGISVVGADVHSVDPKDGQELRQDESILETQLVTCIGKAH